MVVIVSNQIDGGKRKLNFQIKYKDFSEMEKYLLGSWV